MFGYAAGAVGEVAGFLTDLMDVYEASDASGAFDRKVNAEPIACKLAVLNVTSAPSAALRADMIAQRVLAYDPTFQLTRGQQVEIAGERWNPVPGTFVNGRGIEPDVVYRRVDVRFDH
jgi:hypothetical protein